MAKPLNRVALSVIVIFGLTLTALFFWNESRLKRVPVLSIQKMQDGGFTFMLDGKPHLVRGVCYNPIPAGEDYTYDFWSAADKPWITDGKLLKKMGANAVRLYRLGKNEQAVRRVINDLYRKYGIRSFVGHYLGFWDWPPANYADANFRKNMVAEVVNTVKKYKDEPGILGWILGNENNYSFDRNIRTWTNEDLDRIRDPEELWKARAEIYYSFINTLAGEIRKVDQKRPIVMGIGEVKSLSIAADLTPNVDILGVIAYRGATFGNLFRQIKQSYDKPVLMTEFGADRFNAYTREEDEESQARFVQLQWKDIERNSTVKSSKGNCIGGLVFEWSDEWWKANENLAHTWSVQDRTAQWSSSSYYYDFEAPGHMNVNEEWWGLVGLKARPKSLKKGLDKRIPKQSYFILRELWSKKLTFTSSKPGAPGEAEEAEEAEAGVAEKVPAEAKPVAAEKAAAPAVPAVPPVELPGTAGTKTPADAAAVGREPGTGVTAPAAILPTASPAAPPAAPALPPSRTLEAKPVFPGVAGGGAPGVSPGALPQLSVSKNARGGYTLLLNGKPFTVRGVCYQPAPVGRGGSYDFWPEVESGMPEDARLLGEMGANSVRIYRPSSDKNVTRRLVGSLYDRHGVYTFLGHELTLPGQAADFADPRFQREVKMAVLEMVRNYRNEPGIIGWLLGTENNLAFERDEDGWTSPELDLIRDPKMRRQAKARVYYAFVNSIAVLIKDMDPGRPVIMGIGEAGTLSAAAQAAPDVDILGITAYRGADFGNLFGEVKGVFDKPVLIAEFGADRFNALTRKEDEDAQARLIRTQWEDIENHSTLRVDNGNAVGGFVFEWTDEWWKANERLVHTWNIQETTAQWSSAAYDFDYKGPEFLNMNEEWWGIVGLLPRPAAAKPGFDQRIPKKAYYTLKGIWVRLAEVERAAPAAPAAVTAGPVRPGVSLKGVVPRPEVEIRKNSEGGFTLTTGGEPLVLRGVVYNPVPVGSDGTADFWPAAIGSLAEDTKLMSEMGVNAVRLYRLSGDEEISRRLIRGFWDPHRIYVLAGHDLRLEDADADYSDPRYRRKVLEDVLRMVDTYKNEPGILGWVLGREQYYAYERRVFSWTCAKTAGIEDARLKRQELARIYYEFVNELARKVKEADPKRLVIADVGECEEMEIAAKELDGVDAVGMVSYRGGNFGDLFYKMRKVMRVPVIILEFGADRYDAVWLREDPESQARYLRLAWRDIEWHSTVRTLKGVVLGGFVYEWSDEWWAANPYLSETWSAHDGTAQWSDPDYYHDYEADGRMNVNAEWFGLVALEPVSGAGDRRVVTPAYRALQALWADACDCG